VRPLGLGSKSHAKLRRAEARETIMQRPLQLFATPMLLVTKTAAANCDHQMAKQQRCTLRRAGLRKAMRVCCARLRAILARLTGRAGWYARRR